ncbi:hypothetical protein HGM15179_003934 [Zosterops borbonicus]|uniref:Uncharacterized protein n=1 Tax=Zosterops borbonicus TaxID=364589 RepID=A0A8K1GTE8_9PASS|nr:hypothetical protein HGM15179_003934 [Zosterops borbonicus]
MWTLKVALEMGIGLFHSVVKEKGLKYWDNWRTNEIAIVKDKKIDNELNLGLSSPDKFGNLMSCSVWVENGDRCYHDRYLGYYFLPNPVDRSWGVVLPRAALGFLRRDGCDDSATDFEQQLELRWLKPDHSTIALQLRASCLCIPVAAE